MNVTYTDGRNSPFDFVENLEIVDRTTSNIKANNLNEDISLVDNKNAGHSSQSIDSPMHDPASRQIRQKDEKNDHKQA